VRHDGAPSEHACSADLRARQKLAVVGVQVGVDLIGLLGFRDFTGARAVVLIEVSVEVHAAISHRVIQFAKAFQGFGGHCE